MRLGRQGTRVGIGRLAPQSEDHGAKMSRKPAPSEGRRALCALIDDATLAEVVRIADRYRVSREEVIAELIRLDLDAENDERTIH